MTDAIKLPPLPKPVQAVCVMVSAIGSTHKTPAKSYYTEAQLQAHATVAIKLNSAEQAAEIERLRADAERYRWIRKQHWNSSDIAVVVSPRRQTRLGAICPSLGLLDDTIDHMRKEQP